ncbi:MAG: AAA family ATPase [Oscillospiraceae bacterium]|jgi:shikimate dehydrogenase|nr:AAA family ATPase [Oscillospiraceae bacterium]
MKTLEYGLLGRTLAHSCSPELHGLMRPYAYELVELEPDAVADFLRHGDYRGLNVTIPYKRDAFALCDSLSDVARQIGAVNTVVRRADGTLYGDNTDYAGFCFACARAGISFAGETVLILGGGGTSQTAQAAVRTLGAAQVVVLDLTGAHTYAELPLHRHCTRIVNTTPVGMYPHGDDAPLVDLRDFPACGGVVDVIYNPLRTRLVAQATALGIPATGGLPMLAAQAKYAGDVFTGEVLPDDIIETALAALLKTRENVALIGMPGCGKTTVGKRLAAQLGLDFVDTDAVIAARAGKEIPCIFAEDGQEAFRDLEEAVLADLAAQGGQVIACGGGAVLRETNRRALRWNSRVVWLERDLSALEIAGRPLSAGGDGALAQLWAQREPLYRALADVRVVNKGTAVKVATKIRRQM